MWGSMFGIKKSAFFKHNVLSVPSMGLNVQSVFPNRHVSHWARPLRCGNVCMLSVTHRHHLTSMVLANGWNPFAEKLPRETKLMRRNEGGIKHWKQRRRSRHTSSVLYCSGIQLFKARCGKLVHFIQKNNKLRRWHGNLHCASFEITVYLYEWH